MPGCSSRAGGTGLRPTIRAVLKPQAKAAKVRVLELLLASLTTYRCDNHCHSLNEQTAPTSDPSVGLVWASAQEFDDSSS
jgi:hypothetical protein